jgi:hypothetical protein
VNQIGQEADGDDAADLPDFHYFSPSLAQPAAKAQVSAKNSTVAPIYSASISIPLVFNVDPVRLLPAA